MAGEEQKRKADASAADGEDAAAKRQKVENGSSSAAAGTGAQIAPELGAELVQRAKMVLQRKAALEERLKKAGIMVGGVKPGAPVAPPAAPPPAAPSSADRAAAAAAVAAEMFAPGAAPQAIGQAAASLAAFGAKAKPATKLPPPLLLDDQGREVDAEGKLIEKTAAPVPPHVLAAQQQQQQQKKAEEDAEKFFDPEIGNRGLRRLERRPRASFQFVEEGKLQKQAEIGRLRAKYGDGAAKQMAERRKAEAASAAAGGDANLIPLGSRLETAKPAAEPLEPLPEVEWWDARILAEPTSYGAVADGVPPKLREGRIGIYVEHPVLIEPPAEAAPPPPQPLKLTKRELKKLRTQRRVAREKEKQELVRQGLLEPPKPKVKISNLMRVLGEEATADPTAIEAEVRKQMAERAAAHEDRNLARMLTPAERKDKKLKKLVGEDSAETHVALYKVRDLTSPQLRFKVDVNARENHMSGACLVQAAGEFCIVVVEGSPKTLRRYEKLMLRRIDWNAARGGEEEEEEEEDPDKPPKLPNYCHLVWQGVVKERHFRKFYSETVHSEAAAHQFLIDHRVGHYYELCAAYQPE